MLRSLLQAQPEVKVILNANAFCLPSLFISACNKCDRHVMIPTVAQATQSFEQLTASLFWSLPGQFQQQFDYWTMRFDRDS
jgi:hypothetical protein